MYQIEGISVYLCGDRSSQPVIFIHGFPFDHTLWDEVIDVLADKYYCISYDIRGFGSSAVGTGQFTMEQYVDDLEQLISVLELEDPILCGFSMGGYIALRAHEREKANYKALILANTTTLSDSDEARLKRAAAIKGIDEEGTEPFLDSFFSVAFTDAYREKKAQKPEEWKTRILRFSPIGIKGGLFAMLGRTDTTQSLKNAEIPVLLITGKEDRVISPDKMKKMGEGIKNSTFVSLDHCGHMSMIENPQGFISAVQSFLEQLNAV
ncbi:MAG TPA: alpha/beta hydrolase [Epsilonproteobacteria bacterium]|nr:alpha/beta hydrolase [Campylobacterota bacterium]